MSVYQVSKGQRDASLNLQAFFRSIVATDRYQLLWRMAVCIQRFVRGWTCRTRIGRLKSKAARDRILKHREEEQRAEALKKARYQAEEHAIAMKALQEQLDNAEKSHNSRAKQVDHVEELESLKTEIDSFVCERHELEMMKTEMSVFVQERVEVEKARTEVCGLLDERRALKEQLQSAESSGTNKMTRSASRSLVESAAQEKMEALEEHCAQLRSINEEKSEQCTRLRSINEGLLQEVEKVVAEHTQAEQRARELASELKQMSDFPASEPNGALDSLRSEILARMGGNTQGHALGSVHIPKTEEAPHAMWPDQYADSTSATRTKFDQGSSQECSRKTIMCQREMFEKLKQRFNEVNETTQPQALDDVEELFGDAAERKRLEEVVRRLRIENANLMTCVLSNQEEVNEHANEAANLLQQNTLLQVEVQELRDRLQEETSGLLRQLEVTMGTLREQTDDLAQFSSRAQQAESRVSELELQVAKFESESRTRSEQCSKLEKGWLDLDQQISVLQKDRAKVQNQADAAAGELDLTRLKALQEERLWNSQRGQLHAECDKVSRNLKAREKEVATLKELLDDVTNKHVPKEDMEHWKVRAETFERKYHQVMHHNQAMCSTMRHMTQAASESGDIWSELQQKNVALQQETEKRLQERKTLELEKQDLEQRLDSLQISCNYFQKKYKSANDGLKATQRDASCAPSDVMRMRSELAAAQRECEEAKNARRSCIDEVALSRHVNMLLSLQSEQLSVVEQAHGQIDPQVRALMHERHQKAQNIALSLKALVSDTGSHSASVPSSQHRYHSHNNRPREHSQHRPMQRLAHTGQVEEVQTMQQFPQQIPLQMQPLLQPQPWQMQSEQQQRQHPLLQQSALSRNSLLTQLKQNEFGS